MSRFLVLWLGCLLVAGFDACVTPAPDEPIRIGVIAPLDRSRATSDGAQLAVDMINASGGVAIEGRPRRLELLVESSERRPETAVSKALELINRQGVVALVGVPLSINAIPVSEVAEKAQIPFIATQSTHPQTTAGKRYTFRLSLLDAAQGRAMALFARHDLGLERIAVVADASSPYSADLAEIFITAFETLGGRVETVETFTADRPHIPALAQLTATAPEAVYMPVPYEMVTPLLAEARTAGLKAPFLGSDSWSQIQDYPPNAGVSYFTDVWAPERGGAKVSAFLAAYRRAYGGEPQTSTALGYDAVLLLAEAMRQGSAEPAAIREALASAAFEGVTGTLRYRGSGDPQRPVLVREIGPGGRISFHREIETEGLEHGRMKVDG